MLTTALEIRYKMFDMNDELMIKPKISVVTPSYNQGQYIEETIQSIINQNYSNLEYIIIDGGSTDNSVEVIKKYEKHLTYWVSEKDSGQSEAINKGFKRSTGEILCWLNSDDVLLPGALNEVANLFERQSELDFLNGNLVLIDSNSNILTAYFIFKPRKWYATHGIFYVCQPAMFWRRRICDSIGFLKEDFHALMDMEFLIRIFENNCNIGYSEKIFAGFRIHSASKSSARASNVAYIRDLKELKTIHGSGYGTKPSAFYKSIYRFEKLVTGIYFRNWLFALKWKGKKVGEINNNNCKYL